MLSSLAQNYRPLYFLASLGNGGLAVSFYVYLLFMIPHPGRPIATYDEIMPLVYRGDLVSVLITLCLAAILFLAFAHLRLLVWNIKEYQMYKRTEAFATLRAGSEEVSLMAIPLTYAMTINVCFVLGAVFVPGLWGVVEYLFPFALLGFLGVGIYALVIFGNYFTRILIHGGCTTENNASLGKLVSVFAFSMISVGFAAPGAMSHVLWMNAIGIFFSIFFAILAITFGLMQLILGTKSMLKVGVSREASVSLWAAIPVLTVLGIAIIRIIHGFAHGFEQTQPKPFLLFGITSVVISLQVMFGVIGYKVMKQLGYFSEYIFGEGKHPGSFAIVCPGVALFVFGMFFVNFALVHTGLLTIFSPFYFLTLLPLMLIQIGTVTILRRLTKKLLDA